jgi:peptidoglycan/LPS O-acetylase OafA/YrhL
LQLPVYHSFQFFCNSYNLQFNFWLYLIVLIVFSGVTYLVIEKPLRGIISKLNFKKYKKIIIS